MQDTSLMVLRRVSFIVERGHIRSQFKQTTTSISHCLANGQQLSLVSQCSGNQRSGFIPVQNCARGTESNCTSCYRFSYHLCNLRNLGVGEGGFRWSTRLVSPICSVAQHGSSHWAMSHHGSNIAGKLPSVQSVQELGEGLPVPDHAFIQGAKRNVFHPLHQLHQEPPVFLAARGKPHSAVSNHNRGHTIACHWRNSRVPRNLGV
mmetsp:Transcript_11113/g.24473  ORF Transcript_11113/g.24473 Transcript_11113/m.24473 type:complete len:205 (-) Transcript_11113:13-627(-)